MSKLKVNAADNLCDARCGWEYFHNRQKRRSSDCASTDSCRSCTVMPCDPKRYLKITPSEGFCLIEYTDKCCSQMSLVAEPPKSGCCCCGRDKLTESCDNKQPPRKSCFKRSDRPCKAKKSVDFCKDCDCGKGKSPHQVRKRQRDSAIYKGRKNGLICYHQKHSLCQETFPRTANKSDVRCQYMNLLHKIKCIFSR